MWGFEQLLDHRTPLYEAIAERYGYVIEMEDVPLLRTEADVLAHLARTIDASPARATSSL